MILTKRLIINKNIYHYREYGEGKPLVLLHGWCNQSSDYEKLIFELGKYYHVYVPDLPNFGKSQSNDLFSLKTYFWFIDMFIEHLAIDKPIIVGHSFGGILALQYAYEKDIRGLVLINSTGLKIYKHLFIFMINIISNSLYEAYTAPTVFFKIFINWIRNNLRHLFNKDFWKLIRYVLYNDYPNLELIDSRTLILWSKGDKIFSKDYPRQLEKRINNSKLIFMPGGHFGSLINTQKCVSEIYNEYGNSFS